MCRLRNIAMPRKCDYRTDRQTPDKVIPMCRYASKATQKLPSLERSYQYLFLNFFPSENNHIYSSIRMLHRSNTFLAYEMSNLVLFTCFHNNAAEV